MFPRAEDGRRSGSALGRAVVADALRVADPAAAAAAERESDWRTGYLRHFRALVEAGLDGGYDIARAGLASVHSRMRVTSGGDEIPLGEAFAAAAEPLDTVTIHGDSKPEQELVLPYRGELLRGDALLRRLDAWVRDGTIEESCAEAVREVAAEPDWLDLSDQRLVVLGAGAEMGPLPAVLAWGGTVIGIDLPRPRVWERVAATARQSAGTLIAPGRTIESAGVDLLTGLPAAAQWLLGIEGRLVLGNYVYAPGAAYPRLSAAVDALTEQVRAQRPGAALAFLATPTDAFAVPAAAVVQATTRFRERPAAAKAFAAMSGNRLLQPNYPPGADPGIADSLVPQQGPNYALAKRIQRWRASVARHDGTTVSFSVAPPTRTRSVLSNRLLAAAYAGAHVFGVEIFEPATSNRLMAALLVHQLRKPRPAAPSAWTDETVGAAHGGLWRAAYQPRTVLGLAAVRGLPAALPRPPRG
ncbi:hypothetical protein Aau02nite_28360 [Amorphoplanes auranticolor]|uniref:Uncharacterized protein n=1 Tax=Actinoplanes auranticolor TaxID=47988 RepID=A0A919S8F8_9ACTN|nr:hypothetical protein Aau02nite_28360 [Actinoplanes auranticolor]